MTVQMDPRINIHMLEMVAEGTKRIMREGFTPSRGGDVSLRDPNTGLIYITGHLLGLPFPYSTFYDFRAQDTAVFELDGTPLSPWSEATIELPMHLAIFRARPDVNCVLHIHPQWSTIFAMNHENIPVVLLEQFHALGGEICSAKHAPAGDVKIGDYVAEALGDRMAALMPSHGAVTVGSRMDIAFANAHYLENVAKKAIFSKLFDAIHPVDPSILLADEFMPGTGN